MERRRVRDREEKEGGREMKREGEEGEGGEWEEREKERGERRIRKGKADG